MRPLVLLLCLLLLSSAQGEEEEKEEEAFFPDGSFPIPLECPLEKTGYYRIFYQKNIDYFKSVF